MYEIRFTAAAKRYLKKLKEKPLKDAFKDSLTALRENPYLGSPKQGDLAGVYGYDLKYKGNAYEIAYTIYETDGKLIVVVLAGTRENFYDELKRYLK
ncbi:type II toxin-antitoxin system RelE/ParE family toxin [Alkalihalobacillus oceani]|uniref:type II toxin-antitoxin system RelE/ParE family toxin n=1 Tax=Halalkalibacter oceani TaxID=1653776 RepID=UPI00203C265F|nr:type II toxin-antitoxin system RelE/ParE family toxin [Halalkalibacter oceani]MCM3761048.1 type II toxin-antitoxin system RelE/ParE family toxin [Halalkalibacter oceani]